MNITPEQCDQSQRAGPAGDAYAGFRRRAEAERVVDRDAYHQPGRNLAMVTITPGIMSIGNVTPDVNMMSRPKMLANPLAASSESRTR